MWLHLDITYVAVYLSPGRRTATVSKLVVSGEGDVFQDVILLVFTAELLDEMDILLY